VISTSGSSVHRLTRAITHPTNKPIATPPILLSAKSSPASKIEKLPATAAATAVRYNTSAMPSLMRLSPSRIVAIRRGTPRRLAIAVAATGSVGETMTPKTKAAGHESPMAACATTATVTAVSGTRPMPKSAIGLTFTLNSRGEKKKAAE
jgi:hypothetical protein